MTGRISIIIKKVAMDQQPVNQQDMPPQESMSPDMVEQPTQPVAPVVTSPKKSHKRAIIMAAIGLLLIAGALVGYVLYSQSSDTNSSADTSKKAAETNAAATPLDETMNVYTDGTSDETKLLDSESSSEDVNDANNAAGNVGDGINENNL
jgi:uncharacterized protein HemX